MLRGEKHEAFLLNQENNKVTVVPIPAPHTVRSFTQNNKAREGDKGDTNRKEKNSKVSLFENTILCKKVLKTLSGKILQLINAFSNVAGYKTNT